MLLQALCIIIHSHQWIQTGVRVRKRPIRVTIGHFLAPVTLKFYGWPWKTIGHLSYATSSFVHHFIAISEFKLELESENAQFGSKSAIFWPLWPSNLTDDLENNRAPLLCYFKLCASFHSHRAANLWNIISVFCWKNFRTLSNFSVSLNLFLTRLKTFIRQLPIYYGGTHPLPVETLVDSFSTTRTGSEARKRVTTTCGREKIECFGD